MNQNCESKREGKLVHSHIIASGFSSNPILSTKLVILYSKIGDVASCRKVFDEMPERSVVSWTALSSGYSQNGYLKEALLVFLEMGRVGVRTNQFSYGSTLRACTSMMCLDRGKQVHGCVEKSWLVNNLFVQSALVDLHSKCGNMEDACYVLESMSERDVVSWNAMLGGYAIQGCANEAFQLFSSMLRGGILPDGFTLGSSMRASSGTRGLMKVIQIHGFIIKLGFEQHNVVAGSLIDAYVKCGLGKIVGSCLLHTEPKSSMNYVVLGSIYAAAGLWDCVLKARQMIEEKNLRKDPAYSVFQNTMDRVLLQPGWVENFGTRVLV